MGIRTNIPRVYLAASLTGGTGSGMFLDLSYLIRRELRRFGVHQPHVVGLLGVPAWVARGSGGYAYVNTRAALTELNHFSHPGITYEAQFDTREDALVDAERPFQRCTLIPRPGNNDRVDRERSDALAGHVLWSELLTPIGRTVYPDVTGPSKNSLSVVGIQRLVWPRSAILRAAATVLAQRALTSWIARALPSQSPIPNDAMESQWTERQLDRPLLRSAFEAHLATALGVSVVEAVSQRLRPISEPTNSEDSDATRVATSLRNLIDLVGRAGDADSELPHIVGNTLTVKVKELASKADSRLAAAVINLVEQPGLRVAGAEEALRLLQAKLGEQLALARREADAIEEQAIAQFVPIHYQLAALADNPNGRGGQTAVIADNVVAPLRHSAMTRLKGLIAKSTAAVYQSLLGGLREYVRELNFVRNQLGEFLKQMTDAALPANPANGVCRPVFPDGSKSVTEAATHSSTRLRRKSYVNSRTPYKGECGMSVADWSAPARGPKTLRRAS